MPVIKAVPCILYKNFILFIIRSQTHTFIHVNKLVDNTCFLEKRTQNVLPCQKYLIFYPKVNLIQSSFSLNFSYIQLLQHHPLSKLVF